MLCRYSTIFDLWKGSTLANMRAFLQPIFCSEGERSSNSRPSGEVGMRLEALAVDNGWAALVVLLLGDPH